MPEKIYNLESDDISNNVIRSEITVTTRSMTQRLGMWGEGQFGLTLILGEGSLSTYNTNEGKNILFRDLSLNILQVRVPVYLTTPTLRSGMWGEGQFGTEYILGAGTVQVFD